MLWKYTSELPPDDDTLYWVAYVGGSGLRRVGDVYLTGAQIRKKLAGKWMVWRMYAYARYEPVTAPPLPQIKTP